MQVSSKIQSSHSILALLKRAGRQLVGRRLFRICVHAFASFGLLLLVARMLPWRGPVREASAAWLTAIFLGLALALLVGRWCLALFRRPTAVDVAAAIEQRRPGFMDSLICAAELEERGAGAGNPVEEALLREIRGQLSGEPLCRAALPSRLHAKRLAWEAVAACLLTLLALRSELFQKAMFGFGLAGRGGAGPGILVEPGDVEAPRGADVRIEALVRRWERDATIEVVDPQGGSRHPMNQADDGFHFTLYGVDADLRYRVVTPSLASRWFGVGVYLPPAFEQLRCFLEPPAYTRQKPTVLDDWRDATMLAGSILRIEARMNVPGEVWVLEGDQKTALTTSDDGRTATLALTMRDERQLKLAIRDRQGRESRTRTATFAVFPDAVPVVEIVQPAEDITLLPEAGILLQARAVDDFALGEVVLQISVGGRRELAYVLHGDPDADSAGDAASDVSVQHWLSMTGIGAEAGDVVAVYLTATDLRQPHPQTGRSEIRFIEVRPDIEPVEGESGEDPQSLDVQRLIAELRRLIRIGFDIQARSDERRENLALQLVAGLSDLRVEIVGQMEQIKAEAPPAAADALLAWYGEGLAEVEKARSFARQADYQASIRAQERALSLFTKLAQELMKNQSSEASDEAEGGEAGGDGGAEDKESRQERMSLAEAMRRLRDVQQELRGLADRQAAQNRRVAGAGQASLEEMLESAGRQAELARRTERLAGGLEEIGFLRQLAASIDHAGNDMRQAESRLSEGDVAGGERSGLRAQRGLLEAAGQADQLARQLASRQLADLAGQFGKLAELESQLADYTQAAAKGDQVTASTRDALREAQGKIAGKTDEMLARGGQLATELAAMFPDAGQALSEAMQASRTRNPEGKMARAANALLYDRMQRAADYQRQAAADLQMVAQEVHVAGDQLPKVSRNELLQALAEAQRAAAEARSGGQSESSRAIAEQAAASLSRLGLQLNDVSLLQLAGTIGSLLDGEADGASSLPMTGRYFEQAVAILRRQLLRLEVEGRENLSRRLARPPEKYEKLVEEYFKSLSEGQ